MSNHRYFQSHLYEFVRDELNPSERKEIEAHLVGCRSCRDEVSGLTEAFSAFPPHRYDASAQRSDAYWEMFAGRVGQRLRQRKTLPSLISALTGRLEFVFKFRPALAYSVAGATLAVLLTFTVWLSLPGDVPRQRAEVTTEAQTSHAVKDYFEESRMLLIGIVNRPAGESEPLDLSVERTAARQLVRQARYLTDQPIDEESAELIRELQRILVELANLEETADIPDVELIRTGVRQENVLFKIRMAEHVLEQKN